MIYSVKVYPPTDGLCGTVEIYYGQDLIMKDELMTAAESDKIVTLVEMANKYEDLSNS